MITRMKLSYPLPDVVLTEKDNLPGIAEPLASGENWQAGNSKFLLHAKGVGSFYVRDGREVLYHAADGADRAWVQLYLNGQVLVALLHQRQIINFHASSFIYGGHGVMILGDTGAGKTSLALSFALNGVGFLSDDLTPVVLKEGVPKIWPQNRKVKLRSDTIGQLKIDAEELTDAESGTGKKYLHIGRAAEEQQKLRTIIKIETGEVKEPVFKDLSSTEKFAVLRGEICSWEYLAGMPETEAEYLRQLVQIIEKVRFVRVVRPVEIAIPDMHEAVDNFLRQL